MLVAKSVNPSSAAGLVKVPVVVGTSLFRSVVLRLLLDEGFFVISFFLVVFELVL